MKQKFVIKSKSLCRDRKLTFPKERSKYSFQL